MTPPPTPSDPQPQEPFDSIDIDIDQTDIDQTVTGENSGTIAGNVSARGDVHIGDVNIINLGSQGSGAQDMGSQVRGMLPPKLPKKANIFISYKRGIAPDEPLALDIYEALKENHRVFVDQAMSVGTPWVAQIRREIFQAHVLIVLLSEHSVQSQMVKEEIEQGMKSAGERAGFPVIWPIRVAYRSPFPYPLREYLDPLHWVFWDAEADTPRLLEEITWALAGKSLPVDTQAAKQRLLCQPPPVSLAPPEPMAQPLEAATLALPLELPEGTMAAASQFYIQRAEDMIALSTIRREGVTITIKGPRQMGKSSLLIRTMAAAREQGKEVVFLDFQLFGKAVLADDHLYLSSLLRIFDAQAGAKEPGRSVVARTGR